MKYTTISACLIGSVLGQLSSVCIEDTSSIFSVEGNYSYYTTGSTGSIYIQQTLGQAYIFYFDYSLGNTYEAWGLYSCQSADTYIDQAEDATDKSPATKEDCNSDPVMFCPALDDDDANSLYDGASPADGELNYDADAFPDFYSCTNWFAYESDANYPTSETLELKNSTHVSYCISVSSGNNNNGGGSGPTTGERTDNGSDSESANRMSSGAKAVLWVILSIFIVACVAAACYFGYHWYQKHHMELRQSMTKDQGDLQAETGPSAPENTGNDGMTLA